MKKVIRKLSKVSSHSYSIVLPKEFVRKYGWKEKQKMTVEDKGRGVIVIKDWRKTK